MNPSTEPNVRRVLDRLEDVDRRSREVFRDRVGDREAETDLKARTQEQFIWDTIDFYLREIGILRPTAGSVEVFSERLEQLVDVRVLQAIYEVDLDEDRDLPLYVGQQVDVFIQG